MRETLVVLGDRQRGAWAAVREAWRLVPSPEASYFWVPISNSVAYVGFLVGAWEEAVLEVAEFAGAAPLGPSNYSKLVLHGWLVSVFRGAVSAETRLGGKLEANDPDDPTTSMRLVAAALSQRHSHPAAAPAADGGGHVRSGTQSVLAIWSSEPPATSVPGRRTRVA